MKKNIVKACILMVVMMTSVCLALCVSPYLIKTKKTTTSYVCYPLYENLEDLIAVSEDVICVRVLSKEKAKWTPYGPEEDAPLTITTDFVIEILSENGSSEGITILREYGGQVDGYTWEVGSSSDLLSVFEVGNTYVLCVVEYPEVTGGVSYTIDNDTYNFTSCYKLTSGPDSVFLVQENTNLSATTTMVFSQQYSIESYTGRYANVSISDFPIWQKGEIE